MRPACTVAELPRKSRFHWFLLTGSTIRNDLRPCRTFPTISLQDVAAMEKLLTSRECVCEQPCASCVSCRVLAVWAIVCSLCELWCARCVSSRVQAVRAAMCQLYELPCSSCVSCRILGVSAAVCQVCELSCVSCCVSCRVLAAVF